MKFPWKKFIGFSDEDPEKQVALHLSAFVYVADSPYANTALISPEMQWAFCMRKVKEIRERIAMYYKYTDGRVKPEDLHEICLYRKELKKLNGGKDLYEQGKALTKESIQPSSRDLRTGSVENFGVLHFLEPDDKKTS